MLLVGAVVTVAMLLTWSPMRRAVPSESVLAWFAVGVVLVVLFQIGRLD